MSKKLLIICIIILLIPVYGGCLKKDKNSDEKTDVVTVKKGNINEIISASGIVSSKQEKILLTPKTIGTVERIYFEENSIVKKDQLLVKLDDSELIKQMEQAYANLSTARLRAEQAETTLAIQPEETGGKISQAEAAWFTAEKQVEQLSAQLNAQGEQLAAKITQAEIALETARENLNQIEKQSPLLLSAAESAYNQAESSYYSAETAFQRQKNLYDQGFISKQDYDIASNKYKLAGTEFELAQEKVETIKLQNEQAINAGETQVKQAEEALKVAEMTLAQHKETSKKQIGVAQAQANQALAALESSRSLNSQILLREKEVEMAMENVKQMEIAIEQIKDQIKKTEIKSPINGTVLKKQVTKGQTVSPQLPLAVIANLEELVIEALVDEGDIGKVTEKQKVVISTDNFPDETFEGEVIMVSSSASDIQTIQNIASYKIVISIKDTKNLLKIGMNTYNDIVVKEKKDVLLIPVTALHQDKGNDIVYISEGNSIKEKIVEIGIGNSENVEILSGLSEGEEIINGTVDSK